ncbi:MAG: cation:proton antiporter [Gammaproteobacteria bacterium]|nr:cation:proton antiporter [Gammaproteobacteria bacterium]
MAKRLRLGAVLGYLLAGLLIGPWGLRLILDAEVILHFAEFGVVLLLFLIGLELNPRRLWDMRRAIVGAGLSQLVMTVAPLLALAILAGMTTGSALVTACVLALSSTPFALQILHERRWAETPTGKTAFSILLFQDIAVIPLLALLPALRTRAVTWLSSVSLTIKHDGMNLTGFRSHLSTATSIRKAGVDGAIEVVFPSVDGVLKRRQQARRAMALGECHQFVGRSRIKVRHSRSFVC